jgi:hypothetical protein
MLVPMDARKTLELLVLLALGGCVTARPVALPNGTQGYAIRCPGGHRDIADCMNKAAEVCGGKYQVLNGDAMVAGGVVAPVGNGAVFVPAVHRSLIVSCQAG